MADNSRPYNPDGVMAYLITFRCYGTWIHGDERGSMDRRGHNVWDTPLLPPDQQKERRRIKSPTGPSVSLNAPARGIVARTVREVCHHDGWTVLALNVLTEHVHLVVSADRDPEFVMNHMKSWATRRLREGQIAAPNAKTWSRHGSTKWLWTTEQVEGACAYVVDGQALPPDI
jgi:REP element-mobilizing transposase RayT